MVGATRQGIVDDQIPLNTVTNCPKQERMIQLAHHNITEADSAAILMDGVIHGCFDVR